MNMPEAGIPVLLLTYQDIYLWVAKQKDGLGEEYRKRAAVVRLSPTDLNSLGMHDGGHVELGSRRGSVVVEAKSDTTCREGRGHMSTSLYSNCLAGYDPSVSRLPNLKHIEVRVMSTEEDITPISDLLVRETVG